MECAYCEKDQSVLIQLPITFVAEKLEREVLGNPNGKPKESICVGCVVDEVFDVMLDEYQHEEEKKKNASGL